MTFSNLELTGTAVTITVGKDGAIQSRRQICTTCASQVTDRSNKLPFATQIYNRHRTSTHFARCCYFPKGGNPGHCALRTQAPSQSSYFHALLLLSYLTCFCGHLVPFLLVFIYLVSLSFASPSHLGTHFICLVPLGVISLSELLPASCFHHSSSSCCLCVLFWFFYYQVWIPSLHFPSPPSYL